MRGEGFFCVAPIMLDKCLYPKESVTKLMATQWSVTSSNHSLGNQTQLGRIFCVALLILDRCFSPRESLTKLMETLILQH